MPTVPCLGTTTFFVPCLGTSMVPCLWTFASALPGHVGSPCPGHLPVPCLETFANALPRHACQSLLGTLASSLPGNTFCRDAVLSWALFLFLGYTQTMIKLNGDATMRSCDSSRRKFLATKVWYAIAGVSEKDEVIFFFTSASLRWMASGCTPEKPGRPRTNAGWSLVWLPSTNLECPLVRGVCIYKTVVCDHVFALNRPCAYPAVLRHASGPTGPRNS